MHMCKLAFVGMRDKVREFYLDFAIHFRLSKLNILGKELFYFSSSVCKLYFLA